MRNISTLVQCMTVGLQEVKVTFFCGIPVMLFVKMLSCYKEELSPKNGEMYIHTNNPAQIPWSQAFIKSLVKIILINVSFNLLKYNGLWCLNTSICCISVTQEWFCQWKLWKLSILLYLLFCWNYWILLKRLTLARSFC